MPPNYVPVAEPGYDPAFNSTASKQGFSSYNLFLPHAESKVEFVKATYDKKRKLPTVFRPFACRSFSDPMNAFEPYRKDPGGRNYFGYWVKRVYVAWNVGKPATTFIVHNPIWGNYDARLLPLSVLVRAIAFAIKKGQGKASDWAMRLHRQNPFDPDAQTILDWSGYREGGEDEGASLTAPKELFLMQGIVPMLGGDVTFGPGKQLIGWGQRPTCVFGMTGGLGNVMVDKLNQERENFRGNAADFENRYVEGDPVAPEGGRFIYMYPKGGDPRQGRYQSQPVAVDMFATQAGIPGPNAKPKEEIGYDCHFDKSFQGLPAAMGSPSHRTMMRDKWLHWDEVKDPKTGKVVDPGILWYPTYVEQAGLLSRILPASMLVYAFYGEHNDWLTKDILDKSKAARSASVPQAPPPPFQPPAPEGSPLAAAATDPNLPEGWGASLPAAETPPASPEVVAGTTASPWDSSVPDQSLPPAADFTPAAVLTGTVDDVLASYQKQADEVFGGGGTEPAVANPPAPAANPGVGDAAAGFDPPVSNGAARTSTSVAALAAAKAKMRAAQKS